MTPRIRPRAWRAARRSSTRMARAARRIAGVQRHGQVVAQASRLGAGERERAARAERAGDPSGRAAGPHAPPPRPYPGVQFGRELGGRVGGELEPFAERAVTRVEQADGERFTGALVAE